ncbi:tripartite tricarboxylate transporter substrate binding protein [Ideonella sp. 4Y16]|uniref:Bug family tripartite tricarboxylate transporter substrate binding protein n=1 Tax=Ideonella alba TaxID=2824118 RepID=UPI001B37A29B|nr:tripartite tricarboxylate transporter substrate binding protein [Ideonella alba]MBQ0944429.1 tripartite tricarboxylate transporter substrate binding protein [Ideonella alba]
MTLSRRTAVSALALGLGLGTLAHAQAPYPNGPIRFLVPYPPGGPTDLMARMLQPELQKRLGVPVLVENKGGAGGNLGSAEVAKQAPADGQTLLLAASGPMAVNGTLFRNMPFNAINDLAPVVQLSAFPLVLEVHPSLNVKTLKEFLAVAKAQKEPFTFASAGNGTPQHLAGELFSRAAGVPLVHVPYRGAGPALNDVLGGQVKVMFDILGSSLPHIQAGKLQPIAVTSAQRSPALPKVPTMAEAGLANFETTAWHGVAVRAGTPAPIIARLNATFLDIFKDPAFRQKWEAIGTPVVAGTPEAFGQLVRTESVRLGRLVRDTGVTAD